MAEEDKRSAITVHIGISSQLFAASLVLMGVFLGLWDIRNLKLNSLAGVLDIASVIMLLLSIIIGALGMKRVRDDGANSNWNLEDTHCYFRMQTILNGLSIIFFFIVFFLPYENNASKSQTSIYDNNQIRTDSIIIVNQKKTIDVLLKIQAQLTINDTVFCEQRHPKRKVRKIKKPCPCPCPE